ncbi:hypothetical protein ASPZODRAFT_13143 [Penicilliopsis zonata CBS 506.65]|uniref:Uncharacterized protein n=1 Tax=Penicilliopsis zonata CBS 506.65 TaxID=1073090 RepID=A0A1L9SS59_9EURO|nr:hypothetical protein ASPZODRAFT_13143 [Penicilliopsis zonata CBS 506.65]OJJ50040.1 hypothetical protein ASPZODRAFT_13143 [Penicilliopsis zonata CBS 506.65]
MEKKVTIDFKGLPAKDDPEFLEWIETLPSGLAAPFKPATLETENRRRERQKTTRRHAPYVSFGDRGTTSSAGLYGSLLRICRPVRGKHGSSHRLRSGLVGVGPEDDPGAWYVYHRASQLLENAQVATKGLGLRVLNALSSESPTLDFLGDRWPVISYSTVDGFSVTVRLWCRHNVVVQQLQVTNVTNRFKPLELELDPSLCMLDLDYLERKDRFRVCYRFAPHGYGIVALEDRPELTVDRERVCVLLSLFKDGKAQNLQQGLFSDSQAGNSMNPMVRPILLTHQFEGPNTVHYTTAFKLQMSPLRADWKHFMISLEDLYSDPQLEIERLSSTDKELNWYLRRNLEHVLSVCSVPLEIPDQEEEEKKEDEKKEDEPSLLEGGPMIMIEAPDGAQQFLHRGTDIQSQLGPVALTCGDFADHRISISGSFFAFMFMLEMCDLLPSTSSSVRHRIRAVCRGHLEWISQLNDAGKALSSNLGVNGGRMDQPDGTDLPPNVPENMPIHILKATQYVTVFDSLEDLRFVCNWLGDFAVQWFKELYTRKNRLTPTWPHLSESDIPVYRLSDQVWIWKALKSLEELLDHVQTRYTRTPHDTLKKFLQIANYLPQRGNLRRFTLENDVLKKRMLSVTRTARETRFLLHSRDTILLYGLEWGFFAGEDAVWKNLIDAQTQHDEVSNDEAQWDNPLRYGLAIEMANKGYKLANGFEPSEMRSHAQQILLASSSENGLFPGQLDAFSKEPTLFDRELSRDFYFHVGFEIPCILLRNMKNRHKGLDPSPGSGITPGTRREGRQNPYSKLVDLSNIIEVPEEWLYKYPDFLDFTPPRDGKTLASIKGEAPRAIQEAMHTDFFRLAVGMTLEETHPSAVARKCYASIDDVHKGRKQRKWSIEQKSTMKRCVTHTELWGKLRGRRDADSSKKRLIYLRSPDYTVAALCYLASPELERIPISQFFDRHAKVDAHYLDDDTTVVLNSWETEVHFRFFQIFRDSKEGTKPSFQGLLPPRVRQLKSQPCSIFGSNAYLVDAVISFRIVGDFFDRYWTCHVLQHFASVKELDDFPPLLEVHSSMSIMLECIEKGPRSRTSDAGEKYFSRDGFEDRKPEELREYLQLLVILKNNITSLQGLIEGWSTRESQQGRERPRWTRSDEQKYRKSIKRRMNDFADHTRDIKATAARIEFMITLVSNAQDAIRSTKSLREAENIKLFTYVTVFFLPVGLAISLFSMNGAPDRKVVIFMVVTAAVALLITACPGARLEGRRKPQVAEGQALYRRSRETSGVRE